MRDDTKISSISFLSWALNEEENAGDFYRRAIDFCGSIAHDYEIIVIDDGSTDRTLEILREFELKDTNLKILKNDKNLGVGASMRRAIENSSKEYLIWQTQDWSYDLAWFSENISMLGAFDVIHGVRKLSFSLKNRSDNRAKALVSLLNYSLIRLLFKVPFSDYQNVTLYKTKTVQSISLVSKSSFTSPELLLRTWLAGNRFLEVPVHFNPRKFGVAKGTKFRSILKSIGEILKYRVNIWPKFEKASCGQITSLDNFNK